MVALENSSAVPVRAVAPCVICGSDAWESRIELGEFCIRQCLKCGLGQTYPVPTQEQRSKVHEFVYTAEFMRRAYRVRHNELERRYVRQLRQIELLKMAPGMNFWMWAAVSASFCQSLEPRVTKLMAWRYLQNSQIVLANK